MRRLTGAVARRLKIRNIAPSTRLRVTVGIERATPGPVVRIIAAGGVGAGIWRLNEALGLHLCAQGLAKKSLGPCERHNGEARRPRQNVEEVHCKAPCMSVRGASTPLRMHRPPSENGHVSDIGARGLCRRSKFANF